MRVQVLLLLPALASAAPAGEPKADPGPPDGTAKALDQMAAFRRPPGLRVELFAAEPRLANPVAFCLDEKGRVFVTEQYRLGRGAVENRGNPAFNFGFFLEDDLQVRTLDDRLAMYKKWAHKLPGGMHWFRRGADQVRLLEDTDGDGRADKSTVFAGGFDAPLDGLAAGVLARDGDVYFTCIPHLWRLRDTDGNGVADTREPLLTGFGVNAAFYGHDLHGLVFGPDGKLYFSIGDRGFHVTSKEGKTFSTPRRGAVFRCDPDGANFEAVHVGLRNPQELAFDQHGNLFADDNNCDRGDHARLVYVVEDGDSGWNMAYQSIPDPYTAGPWFAERLWHLPHPGQPGYIVPPVGKIGTGPSGFCFTSGASLPNRYRNAFLMGNFTGTGGIEAFRVKQNGAGFEIEDYHDFLKPFFPTDVDVGPDGKVYVSDFGPLDWSGKTAVGRVFTVSDPQKLKDPAVLLMKTVFAEGFKKQGLRELSQLISHPDQRVRLRAQFEIASRGEEGLKLFTGIAGEELSPDHPFDRLHAIWGLGQMAGKYPAALRTVRKLLSDNDPETRAQAAKVLGDRRAADAATDLLKRLADPEPRVRFFAAQSLGKLGHKPAVGPLFDVLKANADADPFLRHAGVAALARIGDADAVNAKANDSSPSVRLAVVLVQRRLRDGRIGRFLDDADPLVRVEAARAVHDLPLEDLYPRLADLLAKLGAAPLPDGDPLVRRCISAAYRLGGPGRAKAVLGVAANPNFSQAVRAEALAALRDWADPPTRDRVTGSWRTLPKRDLADARAAVEADLTGLLAKTSGRLQATAVGLVLALGVKADEATFVGWAADAGKDPNTRVAAVRLLAARRSDRAAPVLTAALADRSPLLRAEARDLIARSDPARGVGLLADVLDDPAAPAAERQRAAAALAGLPGRAAARVLDAWAGRLAAGAVPADIQLDVLDALRAARTPVRDKLRGVYEAELPPDPVGRLRMALAGGDPDRGRDVFFSHPAAQCVRCHTVGGVGGTAGPDLTKVAAKFPDRPQEHFLEALVLPDAKIADGYASVTLSLADGRVIAGTVLSDGPKEVTVKTPEGRTLTVPAEDIERRTTLPSAMPSVAAALTPRELRDVIEYLSTLR